ncbi:MAG: hypothetical protein CL943_00535 [Candidatus Diapherotrites archaeon]|uniref:UDP-N-acetylglucosamine 2-epimerase domain-containing protein n=1 Tax=Candidatus Iainarchaeum sp. TaxID=3101447 RepID=A0A2D6M029_9ARCH|nr:hypothetical protein [Candidatus Diapherotrites archaeon]|tara:strand:+ start:1071 stop:2831 length:1761 start_codon:yes stop_codon:yes gene_type:complete
MTKLLLVNSKEEFFEGKSLAGKDAIVLTTDYEAMKEAQKAGCTTKIPRDYLTFKECEAIDEKAQFIDRQWYRLSKQRIVYKGVELPLLEENTLLVRLVSILKRVFATKKAIEKEKPETIFYCKDNEVFKEVVKGFGKRIKTKVFKAKKVERNSFNKIDFEWIKKNWKRAAKKVITLQAPKEDHNRIVIAMKERGFAGALKEALDKDPKVELLNLDDFILEKTFSPHYWGKGFGASKKELREFSQAWKEMSSMQVFLDAMKFRNIDLLPLLKPIFDSLFKERFGKMTVLIDAFDFWIKREKPRIIVLWADNLPVERMMALVAKQNNVPTMVVMHGIVSRGPGFVPIYADYLASYGKGDKKIFKKLGEDPKKVVPLGAPRFDELLHNKKNLHTTHEFYAKNLFDSRKKIVAFAAQPVMKKRAVDFLDDKDRINELIIEAFNELKDVQLVIKPHPAEYLGSYNNVIEALGSRAKVLRDINVYDMLNACELLITGSSTVGLEAMILGTPMIEVKPSKADDNYPYWESGAALKAETGKQLATAIKKLLFDKKALAKNTVKRKAFLKEYASGIDGKATKKTVEFVKELAKKA